VYTREAGDGSRGVVGRENRGEGKTVRGSGRKGGTWWTKTGKRGGGIGGERL